MSIFRNDRFLAGLLVFTVAGLFLGHATRQVSDLGWFGWVIAACDVFTGTLIIRSIWRDRA